MAYLNNGLIPLKSGRAVSATRLVPVKQVTKAAYIEVASIITPPAPQPGSPVGISVNLKNTFVTAVDIACVATANGQTIIDTTGQDTQVADGSEKTFNGQTNMPGGNLIIDAYSYFKDTSGQWEQDDHLQITISAENPAAKSLSKYSLIKLSPTLTMQNTSVKTGGTLTFSFSGFQANESVNVSVINSAGNVTGRLTVKADANGNGGPLAFTDNDPAGGYTLVVYGASSGLYAFVDFTVTSTTTTTKPTITVKPGLVPQGTNIAVSVTGFTPNLPIELLVVETGGYWSLTTNASGNGAWDNLGPIYDIVGQYTLQATDSQGITASTTYNVAAFTMPAGYKQIQDTVYPDAATYAGNAQVGIFTFTAPLTIIPGVDWIVQHMIDACVSAANKFGTRMLELQVYSKPASLGSSDYIVSICVEDTAAVSYKRVVGIAPLIIAGIIAAIILIIAIAVTIVILSEAKLKWGGTVKSNTTTTTQAQTTTLTPGQSMVNTAPGLIVTAGAGGATVTSSDGTTTNIPAGSTYVTKAGDSITGGSNSNGTNPTTVTIPANSTNQTYTGPAAATPSGAQTAAADAAAATNWAKVAEYGAIGLGAIGAALLVSSVVGAFKKT